MDWLAPSDAAGPPLDDETLIAGLAAHEDPRLRAALSGLFLLRPQLWAVVAGAGKLLAESARAELWARYMAAAYLQRYWRTRLRIYQGEAPALPDLFSTALALPPAAEGYGKPGLAALAEWHAARAAVPYNRLAEYDQVAQHVFARLGAERAQREPTPAG